LLARQPRHSRTDISRPANENNLHFASVKHNLAGKFEAFRRFFMVIAAMAFRIRRSRLGAASLCQLLRVMVSP
jgi:hypothetical protein